MKLLFDQNLSPCLPQALADIYRIELKTNTPSTPLLTRGLLPRILPQAMLPDGRATAPKRDEKRLQICYAERMSTAIQAELPPELLAQARAFVEEGWLKRCDDTSNLIRRNYRKPSFAKT
jgi:hypothetical protein